MAAPRTGSLGVAFAKGDLYVVDNNLELNRFPVGSNNQVIIADSAVPLGIRWADANFVQNVSFMCDAVDCIFKTIDLGGGAIPNPEVTVRGTHQVLSFDDAIVEGIPWQRFMPVGYTAGSSLRVKIYWVSLAAVAGDVIWAAAFERDNNAGHDIDGESFAALQTAAASTAPATSGIIQVASIDFTQAQADAVAAGDPLRLFVQRTATAGGDTMVGDAQIVRVTVEEIQP